MKSLSDKEVKENKMNDDIVYGIQVIDTQIFNVLYL